MNEHFGLPKRKGYGGVAVGVHFSNQQESDEMLRALEAAMRNGQTSHKITAWRIQLANMRYRAWLEDWSGWA